MALAAHLTGVLNALVLIALGLAWSLLSFSPLQAKRAVPQVRDEPSRAR